MTPLEGLVMGTRAGDLDPGVLLNLLHSGMEVGSLDQLLNKRAGLAGLTATSDMREIEQRAAEGDESCRLAITLYAHRLRKYIGAYAAVMGGVDAIAFTGGIGENSALIRHRCTQRLEFLGAALDEDRNRDVQLTAAEPIAGDLWSAIHAARLLVVRADEEQAMVREAAALLAASKRPAPQHAHSDRRIRAARASVAGDDREALRRGLPTAQACVAIAEWPVFRARDRCAHRSTRSHRQGAPHGAAAQRRPDRDLAQR